MEIDKLILNLENCLLKDMLVIDRLVEENSKFNLFETQSKVAATDVSKKHSKYCSQVVLPF